MSKETRTPEEIAEDYKKMFASHQRWMKFQTLENQLDNKFYVTSFKQLLKNFNNLPEIPTDRTIDETEKKKIEDELEFIKKVDTLIKKNLTLYEVRKFYEYFHRILESNFSSATWYLQKEFDDLDEVLKSKNDEIREMEERVRLASEILPD